MVRNWSSSGGRSMGLAERKSLEVSGGERERKWGEKERGPSNDNKTGTHINSVWI